MAKEPNILYSTNCLLAHRICERYYQALHYIWCSTVFGSPGFDNVLTANPPSSTPYERYRRLEADLGPPADAHSSMISGQRAGIKYGATVKHAAGAITATERDEIIQIADQADPSEFTPLMYVIPYSKVKKLLKQVPLTKKAHALADEWIIEELPRDFFDIQRY